MVGLTIRGTDESNLENIWTNLSFNLVQVHGNFIFVLYIIRHSPTSHTKICPHQKRQLHRRKSQTLALFSGAGTTLTGSRNSFLTRSTTASIGVSPTKLLNGKAFGKKLHSKPFLRKSQRCIFLQNFK